MYNYETRPFRVVRVLFTAKETNQTARVLGVTNMNEIYKSVYWLTVVSPSAVLLLQEKHRCVDYLLSGASMPGTVI